MMMCVCMDTGTTPDATLLRHKLQHYCTDCDDDDVIVML
jgi:hypothetical protein